MIKNKINNKIYVGGSTDVQRRLKTHINDLNKYGKNNFEFSVLEECDNSLLAEREEYWINYTQAYSLFNEYL